MTLDVDSILTAAGANAPWFGLVMLVSERWRGTIERALVALRSARIIIEPAQPVTAPGPDPGAPARWEPKIVT